MQDRAYTNSQQLTLPIVFALSVVWAHVPAVAHPRPAGCWLRGANRRAAAKSR